MVSKPNGVLHLPFFLFSFYLFIYIFFLWLKLRVKTFDCSTLSLHYSPLHFILFGASLRI